MVSRDRFATVGIVNTLLVLAAFAALAWSLNSYFISDDFLLMEKAHLNLSGANLWECLAGCVEPWGNGFWRPLFNFWFTLLYFLFGWTPELYHIVSIAIHALNSALLYLFLLRWLPQQSVLFAFFGAALFAVHPAAWEATAWISAQSELLVVTVMLLALLASLALPLNDTPQSCRTTNPYVIFSLMVVYMLLIQPPVELLTLPLVRWLIGVGLLSAIVSLLARAWRLNPELRPLQALSVCFIAAPLLRENGFLLLPLLLAFDLSRASTPRWQAMRYRVFNIYPILGAIYAIILVMAWGHLTAGDPTTRPEISLAPLNVASNLLTYLGVLLWPAPISTWLTQLLGGAALLGVAALFIWGAARHRLLAAWLLLALAPVCLWLDYTPSRYLYFPSAAFCLLLALLVDDALRGLAARLPLIGNAARGLAALLLSALLAVCLALQWSGDARERYFHQAEAMRELASGLDVLRNAKLMRYEVWWVEPETPYPHEASRLARALSPQLECRTLRYLSRAQYDELLARPHSEESLRNVAVFIDGEGPQRADHLQRGVQFPPGFSTFSESLALSIPPSELYVTDNWIGMENRVGGVAVDSPDDRSLAIGWNFGVIDVWEYRLYVEVNRQPPELLTKTAEPDQRAFEWRPGRGLVSPLLLDGPQHGESYRFIAVAETAERRELKIEAVAPVLYQVEGMPDAVLSPLPLLSRAWRALQPDSSFLAVTTGRDSLDNLEGGFAHAAPGTKAFYIQWHTPHHEVADFHIYVSVDGAAPIYFARTGDGKRNFYEWRPRAPLLEALFINGPEFGRDYRFIVYPIGPDGRLIPGATLEMEQAARLLPFPMERGAESGERE